MPAAAWCWPAARRTLAAQAVREKVLNAASHLLEASVADLVAEDGRVTVVGTDRSITLPRGRARGLFRAGAAAGGGARRACRHQDVRSGVRHHDAATHIATVEIDPETYEIRVERFVVAEDCGRLVNPLIVDGQVHGGVAQGIGAALYEEVIYDERGQVTTAQPRRLSRPVGVRDPADAGGPSRKRVANDARRLSRHGRRRHDRRAGGGRQRCRRRARLRSGSKSTNFRQRRSGCSA